MRSRPEFGIAVLLPAAYFLVAHLLVGDAEPRYLLPLLPGLILGAGLVVSSWAPLRVAKTRAPKATAV